MFTRVAISQLYVLDQDAALDFYVGKLGLEVRTDVDLGVMRWLTVGVPGDPREILLELPGGPMMDAETAETVRRLVPTGEAGGWLIFHTDDCRQTYETLVARGVEMTQEPMEQAWGIDCAGRDPFGNHFRITQPPA
ncbi:VOC family protein [Tepidiforma flava]|uniref:VOC family protein n=1 Tax=Tepidiforma flava TaxID=3004094 RepID=A0ABY7M982_9CHLR|nr:VOC family protein [Tepidiforma flava]WBL36687.1 VOC family protein [Tepidiforma flava]